MGNDPALEDAAPAGVESTKPRRRFRVRNVVIGLLGVFVALGAVVWWFGLAGDPCRDYEVSAESCPGIYVRLEVTDRTIKAGEDIEGKLVVQNRTLFPFSVESGLPIGSVIAYSGTHEAATGCHAYAGVGTGFRLEPWDEWTAPVSDSAVRNNCKVSSKPLDPGTYEFVAPLEVSDVNHDRRFDGEIWTDPIEIEVVP